MNNEFAMLTADEMEENGKLYGMVEVDQLRPTWKARKFPIEVSTVLMQSGLLPSIFDWPLLGQLMPMAQAMGEAMLQQRINDLELMNSLTTSLQRIEIRSEPGIGIDVVLGRPSYNVLVLDNGRILVKELPSLHIHVYAVESRAAAGHECALHDDDEEQLMLQQLATASESPSPSPSPSASESASEHGKATTTGPEQQQQQQLVVEETEEVLVVEEPQQQQHDEQQQDDESTDRSLTNKDDVDDVDDVDDEQQLQSLQLTNYQPHEQHDQQGQQVTLDFLCSNLTSLLEDGDEGDEGDDETTDFLTESEEQNDHKLNRRMSFWMRVGYFLRQNIPRFN